MLLAGKAEMVYTPVLLFIEAVIFVSLTLENVTAELEVTFVPSLNT